MYLPETVEFTEFRHEGTEAELGGSSNAVFLPAQTVEFTILINTVTPAMVDVPALFNDKIDSCIDRTDYCGCCHLELRVANKC